MTFEERSAKAKQAAKERREEKARMEALFPYACLSGTSCEISLEAGDPDLLRSRLLTNREWNERTLLLADDVGQLATFIQQLIVRYNALVDEVNATAASCQPLHPLKKIAS